MFCSYTLTCNFWGGWDAMEQLSHLPEYMYILGRPSSPHTQRLRVQQELLRHRIAHAQFWQEWWLRAWVHEARMREAADEESTHEEVGGRTGTAHQGRRAFEQERSSFRTWAEGRLEERSTQRSTQRSMQRSTHVPSSARCECGEVECTVWPECINALADLLSDSRGLGAERTWPAPACGGGQLPPRQSSAAGHDGAGVLTPLLTPQMEEHCWQHGLTPVMADLTDEGKRRRGTSFF